MTEAEHLVEELKLVLDAGIHEHVCEFMPQSARVFSTHVYPTTNYTREIKNAWADLLHDKNTNIGSNP